MLAGRRTQLSVAVLALLLNTLSITATPTNSVVNRTSEDNFNCPADCHCAIPEDKKHTNFLHAKCSSLQGLRSATVIEPRYPIHSIDLSGLGLPRLWNALDNLTNVTTINLSHNELHEIGHLGRRIKKLNLRNNRITSSKLTKLPSHLTSLNLRFNDITYLPLEFKQLTFLANLELADNDINCTCETLEVRNWLQEQQVFTQFPVICRYPAEVSGKSWLQVKRDDICDKEKNGWYLNDDENDLLLQDAPFEASGEEDDVNEFNNTFIRVADVPLHADFNAVEGSGDLTEAATVIPLEDNDEGSGSGGGVLPIVHMLESDDFEPVTSDQPEITDDQFDTTPVEAPASSTTVSSDIFGTGLGIFDGGEKDLTTHGPEEKTVVQLQELAVEAISEKTEVITEGPDAGMSVKEPPKQESRGTFVLLGILLLLVVGLLLYVGIQRCNKHQNVYDTEAGRQTELLDMDKKNLGKPLQRNGNEHAPLITEKPKIELTKSANGTSKKPYEAGDVKDGAGQQLLNGNGATPEETKQEPPAATENPPHQYYPITPRYPTPKSPRASKYSQYPASTEDNNNTTTDDAYLPSSPKLGRYSPVYSPETGRVKIKLTETPKPKTPMLVTRSKSNAGDIITTPVVAEHIERASVPVNGQLQH